MPEGSAIYSRTPTVWDTGLLTGSRFFECFSPLVIRQIFQPVAPLLHTNAGFGGDEEYFRIFIEFGYVGLDFFDVEVRGGEDIDFVNKDSGCPGENHRVFGGFVVAFGD